MSGCCFDQTIPVLNLCSLIGYKVFFSSFFKGKLEDGWIHRDPRGRELIYLFTNGVRI